MNRVRSFRETVKVALFGILILACILVLVVLGGFGWGLGYRIAGWF